MATHPGLDLSDAVEYHYDQFPPHGIDAGRLIMPIASASAALARYDQMLKGMHNSEILLAPLRNQEAVVSSRMEGTVSTRMKCCDTKPTKREAVTALEDTIATKRSKSSYTDVR